MTENTHNNQTSTRDAQSHAVYKNISLTVNEQKKIAHLVFNRPNSGANLFDVLALEETVSAAEELMSRRDLKGLIISSAKPKIFIAGADLNTLGKLRGKEMEDILVLGQKMANSIEALPFPKVAAINGACAGGGYELALACDWRVSGDASSVKIGLPETKLGILPGWGGSTRLPKLIGLPNALPLILGGKLLNAQSAKRKGLTDEYCPSENLLALAEQYLEKGFRTRKTFPKYHNPLSVAVIRSQARKNLMKKTRGHYPALLSALNVCCDGVGCTLEKSLQNERDEFLRLSESEVGKNLLNLFFLSEKAKKLKITEGGEPLLLKPVKDVVVIGSGVMGAGIAYWLTGRGFPTLLKDLNPAALAKGISGIDKLYAEAKKRHVMSKNKAQTCRDLLSATTQNVPLTRDLIIEAAVEDLGVKKKIFTGLAAESRPDTILATNTSALPISEIAASIPYPERVIGIHFFNPVHRMPLVEIVKTEYTSPETLAATVAFVQRIGKSPVIVKDSPGFLVNRVLVPYLVEAAMLFINGADPKVIDEAMLDFGMPMGPIRLLDEVGLDVGMHVAHTLAEAFPDRMHVPDLLQNMIEKGHLGKKTGKGFYLYEKGKSIGINPEAAKYQTGQAYTGDAQDIAQRLSKMMCDETQRCVDDGIISSAEEADLAMILGTGFAPFKGGPVTYLNNLNK